MYCVAMTWVARLGRFVATPRHNKDPSATKRISKKSSSTASSDSDENKSSGVATCEALRKQVVPVVCIKLLPNKRHTLLGQETKGERSEKKKVNEPGERILT